MSMTDKLCKCSVFFKMEDITISPIFKQLEAERLTIHNGQVLHLTGAKYSLFFWCLEI